MARAACRLWPCLDKVTSTCNCYGRVDAWQTPLRICDAVFFPEGAYFMSSTHVPADPASVSSLSNQDLESTLRENRVFPPPAEFSTQRISRAWRIRGAVQAVDRRSGSVLGRDAAKELHWFKPWDKVLEWNLPWAKWFVGGKMNLSYNCVDRHALGRARAIRRR